VGILALDPRAVVCSRRARTIAAPFDGSEVQMAEIKTPTPAAIVLMASGALALVGSFLDFTGVGDFGASAWSSGNFPVVTLMALFALISGVVIALTRFAGVQLPAQVAGFSWTQVHLVLGFFAALYALAFLVVKTGGTDRKIGFWLILIACIGSLVGAILLQKEGTSAGPGRPAPPAA
jgi:hypothetical protein